MKANKTLFGVLISLSLTSCGASVPIFTVRFQTFIGIPFETQNVAYGSYAKKPEDPVRNGYDFMGWYVDSEQWDFDHNQVVEDVTLTAQWSIITYTITYNLNNGENNPNNKQTYTVEDDVVLYDPVKDGYSFAGWTDADGYPVQNVIFKGTYGDLVLTANWSINSYSVNVLSEDIDEGTVSGSGVYKYGSEVTINATPKTGYGFAAWYESNSLISTTSPYTFVLGSKNRNIVGKFAAINYTITYVLNGGNNSSHNPSTYTIKDYFELFEPTKDGYSFAGWTDAEGNAITEITRGTYGDLVLTANWSVNSYAISVSSENEDKGTVSGSGVYEYGSEVTITATPKGGYDFAGWYKDGINVSTDNPYTFIMDMYNTELVAKWSLVTYRISYNLDGGTNNGNNPSSYNTEQSKTLYEPVKDGYSFAGWTDAEGNAITEITRGTYGDLVLTANWSVNSYAISVSSENEDKGTVSGSGVYEYGSEVTITATPNEGYKFSAWYESSTLISTESPYTFVLNSKNRNFVARFTTVSFTITYVLNGGKNNSSNKTSYTIESDYTLYEPSYSGYDFAGWYLTPDFAADSKIEAIKNMTGNITLYAKWVVLNKITYSLDGGTNNKNNPTETSILDGDIILKDPTKKLYDFDGWYLDDQFKQKVTKINGSQGAITLYAKWIFDGKIYNADDWFGINSTNCNLEFELCNDIEVALPLGICFTGKINGNNHKIKNVTYSSSSTFTRSLFDSMDGATVSNLNIVDSLLCLNMSNTQLSNLNFSGSVTGYSLGSISRTMDNCTITNCSSSTKISGGPYLGGLTSEASNTTFSSCSFNGTLTLLTISDTYYSIVTSKSPRVMNRTVRATGTIYLPYSGAKTYNKTVDIEYRTNITEYKYQYLGGIACYGSEIVIDDCTSNVVDDYSSNQIEHPETLINSYSDSVQNAFYESQTGKYYPYTTTTYYYEIEKKTVCTIFASSTFYNSSYN